VVTCAVCDQPMRVCANSAPSGIATCRPCRRITIERTKSLLRLDPSLTDSKARPLGISHGQLVKARRELAREGIQVVPGGWNCLVCDKFVTRTKGPIGMYCQLHKENNPRRRNRASYWWAETDRQRAKRWGVAYETIIRVKVFERDGWRCQLCRKAVNRNLSYPNPMSASLDHIVPISLGGSHLYLNVQCAHLRCNLAKGSTGNGDQLALIG
jgi:5-methylcytosine-specific restriction endonuclease McrA